MKFWTDFALGFLGVFLMLTQPRGGVAQPGAGKLLPGERPVVDGRPKRTYH
jgi:hypothetical protein